MSLVKRFEDHKRQLKRQALKDEILAWTAFMVLAGPLAFVLGVLVAEMLRRMVN